MHWVWATGVNGDKVPINLELIATMMRGKALDNQKIERDATLLFYGTVAVGMQGPIYASTAVLETPEQIFALPRIEIAPSRPAMPQKVRK